MDINLILIGILIFLNIILLIKSFLKSDPGSPDFQNRLSLYEAKIEEYGKILRSEFSENRKEYNTNFQAFRSELGEQFNKFTSSLEQKTNSLQNATLKNFKDNRDELAASLKSFEDKFSRSVAELSKNTADNLEKIRGSVDSKLAAIQNDNNAKLEQMRQTVDEKLHSTLERRLGESFKLVSDRLESVQKGLGEMQSLANGVGDLKKVLSNVKTKGVIGEYQLGGLLEQLMTPAQYEKNVKTKKGSRDSVEFAIKIPDKNSDDSHIWLPIDAKFPTEDYERLQNAYEKADRALIDESVKSLSSRIEKSAKEIFDKYVDPPYTTDFAVMFLPFEGLYAEVLRIPGLFEKLQKNYKVIISGPTTISAFLSSLQMGFRTLAIEKRSVEVWQVLGAVKTEFGKFGDIIEQAKKKLDAARDELDKTGARTKKINSNLKKVESLPERESVKMLGIDDIADDPLDESAET